MALQYIGARYVPGFKGTYDNTQTYEALDVVDNGMGTSYIAKIPVPAGTPLNDTTYWALYGASSGAIVSLQQQIDDMKDVTVPGSLQNQITDNTNDIASLAQDMSKEKFNNRPAHKIAYYGSIINKNCQGMCVDENGIIYLASTDTSPNCTITRINLNGTVVDTHNNLTLYHANDMTFINDRLYIASTYQADGSTPSKTLVVLDLATWSAGEINPFTDTNETQIFGVTKFDDDHIICALTTTQSFADVHFYMLDLTTYDYEELAIENPNNLFVDFYSLVQSIEYSNGKLYLLVGAANGIFEFTIEGTKAVLTHIIGLSGFYSNGIPVGELEALALLPSGYGGTMLINSLVAYTNYGDAKFGMFNPNGNMATLNYALSAALNSENPQDMFVNGNASNIIENGTLSRPFKRIMDAINVTNSKNELFETTGVVKVIQGSYLLPPTIKNKKIHLELRTPATTVTITNAVTFNDCEVIIDGGTGDATEATKYFKFTGFVYGQSTKMYLNNVSVQALTLEKGSTIACNTLYTNGLIHLVQSNGYIEIIGSSVSVSNPLVSAESRAFLQAIGSLLTLGRISYTTTATVLLSGNPT